MNKLSTEERIRVVAALTEGNSMRTVSRMTGVARNTVNSLLVDLGSVCSAFQDEKFRKLSCKRIRCEVFWSFVGAKEENTSKEKKTDGWGDVWTWVAVDADTKLIPCWFVGTRDAGAALHFIQDLADRVANHIQLTTNEHKAYLDAVGDASSSGIDYAMLIETYGAAPRGDAFHYRPAQSMGAKNATRTTRPDWKHNSTSSMEGRNPTVLASTHRFARVSKDFSKRVEDHERMLALHYMYYNFARVHQTLRVTPAMKAGVADHVWSVDEIIYLLSHYE